MRTFLLNRILIITAILVLSYPSAAQGNFSVTVPGGSPLVLGSCDDYASAILNNPWDMNDASDINNFLPTADFVDFNNKSFSGGIFSATTGSDPYFHLLSPPLSSSQPFGGRTGDDFPIDTSRYTTLSFRMYSSTASELQILWNTGEDYFPRFVITDPIPTSAGWKVYTIDLTTVARSSLSGVDQAWSAAPVTGLRIDPTTQSGVEIKFDWISLYGPADCGSDMAVVSATASGDDDRYSAYIDDDNDPFNGFITQLAAGNAATGAQSLPVSAAGSYIGDYIISGFVSGDFATLKRTDPWDFSERSDYIVTGGVVSPTISNGALTGTTQAGSLVFLTLPSGGIDADTYDQLSFRLTRGTNDSLSVIWTVGSSTFQRFIDPTINPPVGDNVFQIDLTAEPNWSGTVTSLIINPSVSSGNNFSLDWVSLRTTGLVTTLTAPTVGVGASPLRINAPPLLTMVQPDAKGGEGFTPWNMSTTDDIVLTTHLAEAEILPFSNVEGRDGDFFRGLNLNNNDDPINWSRFFTIRRAGIDSSKFYRLSYALNIPGDIDIVLGSVARVYWYFDDNTFAQSSDIVVYEGWNEYTFDLRSIIQEDFIKPWEGTIDSFRIDSHEFLAQREYYFDYIHIRADDRADDRFTVTFDFSDADHADSSLSLSLFYTTTKATSGGTLITTFTPDQASNKGFYLWDTSALPEGTYYVYGVLSDGLNSVRRVTSGPVKIERSYVDDTAPILELVAPSEGGTFDEELQVKGFSLDNIQLSEVRVYSGTTLLGVIRPSRFDPLARAAHPTLIDSSNAGFNEILDTSSLADGAQTVRVVAIDTNGNETEVSFNLTKQDGATLTVIPDATPTGERLTVPNRSETMSTPRIQKATVSRAGRLRLEVKNLNTGCTLAIRAGRTAAAVTDVVAPPLSVTGPETINGAIYTATTLAKTPATLHVRAVADCGVQGTYQSAARRLKLGRGKGTYAKALKRLKSRIRRISRN